MGRIISGIVHVLIGLADVNGYPIGLLNSVMTNAAGTGTLNVVLKHQPGIKDGSSTTGETDVELLFQLEVQ